MTHAPAVLAAFDLAAGMAGDFFGVNEWQEGQ